MFDINFRAQSVKQSLAATVAALLLAGTLAVPVRPAIAQADSIAPVEAFSKELEQLKNTFGDLGKKIDESTKSIDGLTDVEKARREIEDLRGAVGNLLGAVADNGSVARLGASASDRVREKLAALERDTRFKPEERQFLIEQWRKLKDETERATSELGAARKEFAGLLRALQANEDFIDELVQIRQAQKAIDVIRKLTSEIRDASGKLKALIGAIKPPGA
jgi:DNA repair exonuclease SbcCD ATPase subunit